MTQFHIRPIQPGDDAAVATLIRTVMPEFGAVGQGFAINDPEVDWMAKAYAAPRSSYFVVERDGEIQGGGGIAPLAGGDGDTCELRKMYFLPSLRGMSAAQKLYERSGFARIDAALGDTGHGGCNTFMVREL